MRTSESIKELAAALSAAQGEFKSPERNREVKVATKAGGEYRFWYSTLDCVMDMARPILAKHGLSITQPPTVKDGAVVVLTRLMHASGQWQEEEIAVTPESFGPQQIGSAVTYMKRYAYCGMLGIASDEDDDGNAASGNSIQESRAKASKPPCPKCGKSEFVLADREVEGRFFCWKNSEKGKLGCGHKWDSSLDPIEPTPEQREKAKEIANGHGMTTGDKVPPKEKSAFQRAKEEIVKAVRAHDEGYLNTISQLIEQRVREGVISADEDKRLGIELSEARRKIKAMEQEPVGA